MSNLPPTDLTGLWWLTGTDPFKVEAKLADPATHGTYQRGRYFLVIAKSSPSIQPADGRPKHHKPPPPPAEVRLAQLLVFDENGDFARFEWDPDYTAWNQLKGAWVSHNEAVTFAADAKVLPPGGDSLTLPPVLSIQKPAGTHACPLPRGGSLLDADLSQPVPLRGDMPTEYIAFDPAAKNSFDWVQPHAAGITRLVFERVKPVDSQAGAGDETWNNMFRHSYKLNGSLFVGYKPRELNLYDGFNSGTDSPQGRVEGQKLPGAPVFAYPAMDSRDYVRSQDQGNMVTPLGEHWMSIDTEKSNEFTHVMSTELDRTQATSLSLGLSAGIKGLANGKVDGSYEIETKTKKKLETRYSLSVKTEKSYALIADGPNRRLDQEFHAQLLKYLKDYYRAGKALIDEGWHGLTREYGTHYANAVTFGMISRLQTRLTALTEATAVKENVKIHDEAKIAFDKFLSLGGKVDASFTWGNKLSTSVSREDKSWLVLGAPSVAPIFLDLRPIAELLSPLYFDYDPNPAARDERIAAPFIWHRLRRSLHDYLKRKHGLDQPLDAALNRDYTPRVMTLSFPSITVTASKAFDWPCMYGTITFSALGDPEKVAIVSQGYSVGRSERSDISNGGKLPGYDRLECTIAAAPGDIAKGAGVRMTAALKNSHWYRPDDDYSFVLDLPINKWPPMPGQLIGMISLEAAMQGGQQTGYVNLQYKYTEIDVGRLAP